MFIEKPANKSSISRRKALYGIGINDADYVVSPIISGNRSKCPFYQRWQNMVERCYSKRFIARHPTYKDCTVCQEWLTFSNFKSWMTKQDWQGLSLDKDIITPGNKIYSPEFCVFITQSLNTLMYERFTSKSPYPIGVFWDKRVKRYTAQIGIECKNVNLGYFSTIGAASKAYVTRKLEIILKEANKQTDNRVEDGLRMHAELLIKHNPLH